MLYLKCKIIKIKITFMATFTIKKILILFELLFTFKKFL